MKAMASISALAAAIGFTCFCGCSPRPDANAALQTSLGRWLLDVGLATNSVRITEVRVDRNGRDRCDFSCRVVGLRKNRPMVQSKELLEDVRFGAQSGANLVFKSQDLLQLPWPMHLPSTGLHPIDLTTNAVGYYIKFKSEATAVAILFEGEAAFICGNSWNLRHNAVSN